MITRVVDRSADGSMFQLQCEGCGLPLDWVTGLELTVMAVKGYKNFCFDCDQGDSELVHRALLLGGVYVPDCYTVGPMNGPYTHYVPVVLDEQWGGEE